MIQLGEVSIAKVVEIPRSTYPTTSMLPDSSAADVERHYTWLKPHFSDEAVGDLASRIQTYVVRTLWRRAPEAARVREWPFMSPMPRWRSSTTGPPSR